MPLGQIENEGGVFAINGFFGGLNTVAPVDRVPDNAFVEAKNAWLTEGGVLTIRPDTASKMAFVTTTHGYAGALGFFGASDERKLYAVLYSSSGNEKLFYANKDVAGSISLPVITGVEGAGSLTFVREGTLSSTGNQYVYVTTLHSAPGKVTVTDALTAPTFTAFLNSNSEPPADVGLMERVQDRIFQGASGGTKRDLLYYSATSGVGNEVWDRQINRIRVPSRHGESITGIAAYRDNNLLVGLSRSLLLLSVGTDSSLLDWGISTISTSIGVGAARTMVMADQDLLFMDQFGEIRSLETLLASRQQPGPGVGLPLSLPIKEYTDDIDFSKIQWSHAAYFNGKYWLTFRTNSAPTSKTFVYDTRINAWTGPIYFVNSSGTPLELSAFAVNYFDIWSAYGKTVRELYVAGYDAASSTLHFLLIDGSTAKDYTGTPIELDVKTKRFDFGMPDRKKALEWLEVQYDDQTNGGFTIEARKDLEPWQRVLDVRHKDTTKGRSVRVPLGQIGLGTTFQFRIRSGQTSTTDTLSPPKITRLLIKLRPFAVSSGTLRL